MGEGVPIDEELEDGVEDGMMSGEALDEEAGVGGWRWMRGEQLGADSDSSDALRGGDDVPGVEDPLDDSLAFSRACTHRG